MREIGYLTFIDNDDELVIYSDDFVNFYDENGKILNEEKELKKWAIWLNSPFSDDYFKYIISFDSEKKEKNPLFSQRPLNDLSGEIEPWQKWKRRDNLHRFLNMDRA